MTLIKSPKSWRKYLLSSSALLATIVPPWILTKLPLARFGLERTRWRKAFAMPYTLQMRFSLTCLPRGLRSLQYRTGIQDGEYWTISSRTMVAVQLQVYLVAFSTVWDLGAAQAMLAPACSGKTIKVSVTCCATASAIVFSEVLSSTPVVVRVEGARAVASRSCCTGPPGVILGTTSEVRKMSSRLLHGGIEPDQPWPGQRAGIGKMASSSQLHGDVLRKSC
mmetsp:Transcript_33018/g.94909  ORF Transcript_33018/g.94909 Transcript_33018/m.94909 type:complete len:222 (+) Transcript_33018:137-802(+)